MNIVSIFILIFHNKLFCYLILSHKELCYFCLWNSRNRICFFHAAASSICYGKHWILLHRNLSIPFTQTRHPFLGSTLCTQHDEDWLRNCRISTHIQTYSLPPYVLVSPPPFSYSCNFFWENSWFFAAILVKRIQKRHRVVQMKFELLIQRYEASKHDWIESWWGYHKYRSWSLKCTHI